MLDLMIILLPIAGGLLRGSVHKRMGPGLSKSLLLAGFVISSLQLALTSGSHYILSFHMLALAGNHLELSLVSDPLARLMTAVVLFLGLVIHSYSERYLRNEQTLGRFLFQMGYCLTSVLIFAHAANIWSAFVGWQMIGLSIFLLLNHYHFDQAGCRAARKKFLINRVGDTCFLIALIWTIQQGHQGYFSHLDQLPNAPIIVTLLIIAVMTKSAQYPFHQWLPETMQAPTPVSALMHAGVINAGGILLARVFPVMVDSRFVAGFVVTVGSLTMLYAASEAAQKYDIKRKLAYSTMGQMGYMVLQAGLGCPTASVFHLIAHGFYKATLFLNNGNAVFIPFSADKRLSNGPAPAKTVNAIGLSVFVVGLGWYISAQILALRLPAMVFAFFLITTVQVMVWLARRYSQRLMIAQGLMYAGCIIGYLAVLKAHAGYLTLQDRPYMWPLSFQYAGSALLIGSQLLFQYKPSMISRLSQLMSAPLSVLTGINQLKPLIGSRPVNGSTDITLTVGQLLASRSLKLGTVIVGGAMAPLAIIHSHNADVGPWRSAGTLVLFLLGAMGCLLIAYRSKTSKALICWFILFQLLVSAIVTEYLGGPAHWMVLHIINVLPVLMIAALLLTATKRNRRLLSGEINNNKLSWPVFYLTVGFVLLTALPGTVSFVELYSLLSAACFQSIAALVLSAMIFILLAGITLKLLHQYVFIHQTAGLSAFERPMIMHCFCGGIIALDIVAGTMPQYFVY